MKSVWLTFLLMGIALAANDQPKIIPAITGTGAGPTGNVATDNGGTTGSANTGFFGLQNPISFGTVNIPVPAAQISIPAFDPSALQLPDFSGLFNQLLPNFLPNFLLSVGNVIDFFEDLTESPDAELLGLAGGGLAALGMAAKPIILLAKLSKKNFDFLQMFNLPLETASFVLAVIAISMLILHGLSTGGDLSGITAGLRRRSGMEILPRVSVLDKATELFYDAFDSYNEL